MELRLVVSRNGKTVFHSLVYFSFLFLFFFTTYSAHLCFSSWLFLSIYLTHIGVHHNVHIWVHVSEQQLFNPLPDPGISFHLKQSATEIQIVLFYISEHGENLFRIKCVFSIVCHLLESCDHLLFVHFHTITLTARTSWREGLCFCDISSLGRGRFRQMNKCFFKTNYNKTNPPNACLLVLQCQPPGPPSTHAFILFLYTNFDNESLIKYSWTIYFCKIS